jgi:dTDP-4-amino-4,6-dideoxygalactose transaminase
MTKNIDTLQWREFLYSLYTERQYRCDDARFPNASEVGKKALWLPSAFTRNDKDTIEVFNKLKGV